jgi:hypothetical protein
MRRIKIAASNAPPVVATQISPSFLVRMPAPKSKPVKIAFPALGDVSHLPAAMTAPVVKAANA